MRLKQIQIKLFIIIVVIIIIIIIILFLFIMFYTNYEQLDQSKQLFISMSFSVTFIEKYE